MDSRIARFAEDFRVGEEFELGPTWSPVTSLSISPGSTIPFRSMSMRRQHDQRLWGSHRQWLDDRLDLAETDA